MNGSWNLVNLAYWLTSSARSGWWAYSSAMWSGLLPAHWYLMISFFQHTNRSHQTVRSGLELSHLESFHWTSLNASGAENWNHRNCYSCCSSMSDESLSETPWVHCCCFQSFPSCWCWLQFLLQSRHRYHLLPFGLAHWSHFALSAWFFSFYFSFQYVQVDLCSMALSWVSPNPCYISFGHSLLESVDSLLFLLYMDLDWAQRAGFQDHQIWWKRPRQLHELTRLSLWRRSCYDSVPAET